MDVVQSIDPLMGHLLVKPITEPKTQDTGLLTINDSTALAKGEVIKANRQHRFQTVVAPMQVQDDDLIYFFKRNNNKILLNGEAYYLIEESDVAAVIH